MALDSAGYSTSSLFQAKNYDPTALATGLQSAATYDPTQQSTTTPTSNSRFVSNLNSPNNSWQDSASTTQNTSNSATPQGTSNTQVSNAGTSGLTAASNNSINASYRSNLVTAPGVTPSSSTTSATNTGSTTQDLGNGWTVSVGNGQGVAGAAAAAAAAYRQNGGATSTTANSATFGAQTATYSGPSIIKDGTKYYVFNAGTGQYVYAGSTQYTFDKNYNITGTAFVGNGGYSLSNAQLQSAYNATTLANDPKNTLNQQQRLNQIINSSALAGNLAAYQKDLTNAKATNQTAQTTAAATAQHDATLNYLTTHNGQLSAADAQLAGMSFAGSAGISQAQQAAIAQAQTDYAAQQAHAAALGNLAVKPIDTSASDATDRASMNSLISQYASGNAANVGASNVGFNAASLSGQNALNHNVAAATSYNNNLSNFQNALGTQYGADTAATGNQLYSDIQGVQQIAQQLQQEIGQLGTAAGQQAQGQLNSLNAAIQQYQQAVAQYGQNSSIAKGFATTILSSGGSIAAALV